MQHSYIYFYLTSGYCKKKKSNTFVTSNSCFSIVPKLLSQKCRILASGLVSHIHVSFFLICKLKTIIISQAHVHDVGFQP